MRSALLLAGCAVVTCGVLAGCSSLRLTATEGRPLPVASLARANAAAAADSTANPAAGPGAATAPSDDRPAVKLVEGGASGSLANPASTNGRPAAKTIGARFADVALDDHDLGEIRGGLSVGSGLIVNFAFQEATFVNHELVQNVVTPTLTVSSASNIASAAASAVTGGSSALAPGTVVPIGNLSTQLPVNSPVTAVQSLVNNGMTSIVSNIGGGGVSNVISNTANNQLVQQMITANIGITGLSQTVQQSVAATVLSRVQAANSQFR